MDNSIKLRNICRKGTDQRHNGSRQIYRRLASLGSCRLERWWQIVKTLIHRRMDDRNETWKAKAKRLVKEITEYGGRKLVGKGRVWSEVASWGKLKLTLDCSIASDTCTLISVSTNVFISIFKIKNMNYVMKIQPNIIHVELFDI